MIEKQIISVNKLSWKLGIPRAILEDLAATAPQHYSPFSVERPGKNPRIIDNPDNSLKNVQRRINKILLGYFSMPIYLHGGIRDRSAYTNALSHLGQRFVARLDLEDFFPSVTDRQVYSVWTSHLLYSPAIARLLTPLTTYRRHLPQGAPTSSSLANIVLLAADREINEAALQAGCLYTRYVDDLVFSGDHPQALLGLAAGILRAAGFSMSRRKLKIMPAHALQEVTGLSVNSPQRPSVPRVWRDKVRMEIFRLRFISDDAEFVSEVGSIRGRIAHLSKINPGDAARQIRFLDKVILERARVTESTLATS